MTLSMSGALTSPAASQRTMKLAPKPPLVSLSLR